MDPMEKDPPVEDNGRDATVAWPEYFSLIQYLVSHFGFDEVQDVDSALPVVARCSGSGVTMTVRDGIADEVIIDLTHMSSMELNLRKYRSKIIVLAQSIADDRIRLEPVRRRFFRSRRIRPVIYCRDGATLPVVEFIYSNRK